MIRKLMICPWFGPLPDWFDSWYANTERLRPLGYDFALFGDTNEFKQLVHDRLDLPLNDLLIEDGGSKIHDYRCTFGELYSDLIREYDFWGHTDFDCLYGRVDEWVTDEFLDGLDIHSNHDSYICGPWTLYRNTPKVNSLFRLYPLWQDMLLAEQTTGWVETEYSHIVDQMDAQGRIRREYTYWQSKDLNRFDTLRWGADGALFEGDEEIMMAHFRRLQPKVYPPQCR